MYRIDNVEKKLVFFPFIGVILFDRDYLLCRKMFCCVSVVSILELRLADINANIFLHILLVFSVHKGSRAAIYFIFNMYCFLSSHLLSVISLSYNIVICRTIDISRTIYIYRYPCTTTYVYKQGCMMQLTQFHWAVCLWQLYISPSCPLASTLKMFVQFKVYGAASARIDCHYLLTVK